MKQFTSKIKTALMAISLVLLTSIVFANNDEEKKVDTVIFTVEMDCTGCASKIEKSIPFEKGVKALNVDFKKQQVSITYKTKLTNKENLKKAIEKLEFKVVEIIK